MSALVVPSGRPATKLSMVAEATASNSAVIMKFAAETLSEARQTLIHDFHRKHRRVTLSRASSFQRRTSYRANCLSTGAS